MIKKYNWFIVILLMPCILTGCFDYKDINKRTITLSVGVDDINGNIHYSGEIIKMISNVSENKGQTQSSNIYRFSAYGQNFEKARTDFNSKNNGLDFVAATRVNLFGKKYAEKGIESYMNRIYYGTGFRNSVLIAVSDKSAEDILNSKVENDICVGSSIENTVRYLSEEGKAIYKTCQEVQSDILFKDIGYLLPYITIEKDSVKYLGLAVMKDSKLIGTIKLKDSNGFIYILSDNPTSIETIPHPIYKNDLLSISMKLKKRNIKTTYENNKIHIYIDLKLNGKLEYEYNIKSISQADTKKIEKMISDKIQNDIVYAINRTQNEFRCDVFGFKKYFKADNYDEYKKINWQKEYKNINFTVNVKTTITNTSLLNLNAKNPN